MLSKILAPVSWLRRKLGLLFDLVVFLVAVILFRRHVPFGALIVDMFFALIGLVAVSAVGVAVLHRLGYLGNGSKE